mgnify:CR=1 FL=1
MVRDALLEVNGPVEVVTALTGEVEQAAAQLIETAKKNGTWQIPKIEVGLNAYYSYLTGRNWTPYQRLCSSAMAA